MDDSYVLATQIRYNLELTYMNWTTKNNKNTKFSHIKVLHYVSFELYILVNPTFLLYFTCKYKYFHTVSGNQNCHCSISGSKYFTFCIWRVANDSSSRVKWQTNITPWRQTDITPWRQTDITLWIPLPWGSWGDPPWASCTSRAASECGPWPPPLDTERRRR